MSLVIRSFAVALLGCSTMASASSRASLETSPLVHPRQAVHVRGQSAGWFSRRARCRASLSRGPTVTGAARGR